MLFDAPLTGFGASVVKLIVLWSPVYGAALSQVTLLLTFVSFRPAVYRALASTVILHPVATMFPLIGSSYPMLTVHVFPLQLSPFLSMVVLIGGVTPPEAAAVFDTVYTPLAQVPLIVSTAFLKVIIPSPELCAVLDPFVHSVSVSPLTLALMTISLMSSSVRSCVLAPCELLAPTSLIFLVCM